MNLLAVIDATSIDAPNGPATQIAGLSLIERTVRLASVCGADELVILVPPDEIQPQWGDRLHRQSQIPVSIASANAKSASTERSFDAIAILDAGAVYDRGLVSKTFGILDSSCPGEVQRTARSHLIVTRLHTSRNNLVPGRDLAKLQNQASPTLSGGWIISIDSAEAVDRATRRLWQACRKADDGLVARYLNRHISIGLSRILAPTEIHPNHVTAVTFVLGVAAALAAARGEYAGFLIAGILYQLNSIIDGVDGELARVRYQFSVRGEWLDTISDDLADLLMYIGLGIGAWLTLSDAPGPWGNQLWLFLGIGAAVGKVASMAVYYRWLIAHGRGDLLAFQWSFEDESANGGPIARVLSVTRYFFRKDFIVFTAFVFALAGFLPHLLFALAPGNLIVALSALLQQVRASGASPSD